MKPYFYDNYGNRVGDEIQMTAVLNYYKTVKTPGREFLYLDRNRFISAKRLFPDGLVTFVDNQPEGEYDKFAEHNLWIWAPYLRKLGYYTTLKDKWSENPKYDVVFCPLIDPMYNPQRAMNPEWCSKLFAAIKAVYPNSVMLVDKAKAPRLPDATPADSFYDSFEYIRESKIFISGDTGVSHYAGGIGHKKILLLFGDQFQGGLDFDWQRLEMGKILNEPVMMNSYEFNFDSRPDCPPGNFDTLWLFDNRYPIDSILKRIEKRWHILK